MGVIRGLLKLIVGLAIAIPLGIFALAATIGIVGTLLALAIVAFKIAVVALLAVGAYKLLKLLFGSKPKAVPAPRYSLPPADPYYDAAVRELDTHLGHGSR